MPTMTTANKTKKGRTIILSGMWKNDNLLHISMFYIAEINASIQDINTAF